MGSVENANLRTIFAEALETESTAARAAYLDEACNGDADLRARVEALLEAHGEAGDFLGGGASCSGRDQEPEPIRERSGDTVGRYRLLEAIGEGGFGNVFMAEQERPVRRKVALKILKAGMDTRQVMARFEAERQALALMDHPCIARVFDAGTTASGRPYFVMELVRGVPITDYCDRAKLDCRGRVELFVQVCRAVQHAHQKGVIHRDLKPSNVLVTLHDGTAVPKIIDFGVAKALRQPLTEQTLFTRYAQMIGTPLYMSPEQAELSGLDVDTRTDVYSLGVLLYELLTGVTPFEKERLQKAAYDEIRRIIREEDPPTPSQRVSTSGDALGGASPRGAAEVRKLATLLRGELDWIVLKALEKDRTLRYETASALAADIERYLNDEPIEACPPSLWYRTKKLVRRNRTRLLMVSVISVATLVALTAVAGSIGWTLRERSERAKRTVREVEAALRDATRLQEEAWSESDRPARLEAELAAARSTLERARVLLVDADLSVEPTLSAKVRALETKLGADERDRRLVAVLDRIYLERECEFCTDPDHVKHLYPTTVRAYRKALADFGIVPGSTDPDVAAAMITGRREPVRTALVAALDDWSMLVDRSEGRELGWLRSVLAATDRDAWRAEVRGAYARRDREALETLSRRGDAMGQSPWTLRILGEFLYELSTPECTVAFYRRAQKRHPSNLWINLRLGDTLRMNEPREAISYYMAALALRPGAATLRKLGSAFAYAGLHDRAVSCFQRAIELAPEDARYYYHLSHPLIEKKDWRGAIQALRRAIALKPDYAMAHVGLGYALVESAGDLEEAVAAFRKAIALKPDYALAYNNLGDALRRKGDLSGSIDVLQKAIDLRPDHHAAYHTLGLTLYAKGDFSGALAANRKAIRRKPDFAKAYTEVGVALLALHRFSDAAKSCRKAIELDPGSAVPHINLGIALARTGDAVGAIKAHHEAVELEPENAMAHFNLGATLMDQGQVAEAIQPLRRAVEVHPDFAPGQTTLGEALARAGRPGEALAHLSRGLELAPDSALARSELARALSARPEPTARDTKRAVRLAEGAVRRSPSVARFWTTLGIARYRAGDHRAAIEALSRSVALRRGECCLEGVVLAMAHWGLAEKEEARKWYEKARVQMKAAARVDRELIRLREEAKALLGDDRHADAESVGK